MVMLGLFVGAAFAAEVHVYPGDDFQSAVEDAQPGDEVIFHEGSYQTQGLWSVQLDGTADEPIVIRTADGEAVTINGHPAQNAIDIGGSHYTFSGFEIVGGSHGVRVATSNDATFEDLEIHDTGDVGLSCNRSDNTYERIAIRRTHIHHTSGTGECMYLGCNDGACTMSDSIVEYNWCHDTTDSSQGDGIEVKTGSYGVTVRHNVIHDVKYPGITMYGTQGGAPNLVEGNIVWNVVDNGIQTVGDVVVRNNVVFDAGNNGIQAKPSQGEVVSGLTIVHNTVVIPGGTCLRGNDWVPDGGNLVAANALFCAGGTAVKLVNAGGATWIDNGVVGVLDGGPGQGTFDLADAAIELLDPVAWNAYPNDGSALIDAGSGDWADQDFNCLDRDMQVDVGAYEFTQSGNPGWVPQPGFKSCEGDGGGETGGEEGSGEEGSGEEGSGEEGETDSADGGSSSEEEGGPTGDGEPVDTDGVGTDATEAGVDGGDGGSGCSCSSVDSRGPGPGPWSLALGLLGVLGLRRCRRAKRQPSELRG